MTTYDELYSFLKARYKPSRFEGRNDRDYPDYAGDVTRGRLADLEQRGWDVISHHESVSGEMVVFDSALQILDTLPFLAPLREGREAPK